MAAYSHRKVDTEYGKLAVAEWSSGQSNLTSQLHTHTMD